MTNLDVSKAKGSEIQKHHLNKTQREDHTNITSRSLRFKAFNLIGTKGHVPKCSNNLRDDSK